MVVADRDGAAARQAVAADIGSARRRGRGHLGRDRRGQRRRRLPPGGAGLRRRGPGRQQRRPVHLPAAAGDHRADWDVQHDVMARGSFLVSREAARVMAAQGMGGDIVYICSKNAVFAGPDNVAYGAAKADQAHQVRLLAAELGGLGIRVNGINPDGVVRGSGIFAGGWGAQRAAVYGVPEEELGAFYARRTLLQREVLPEHVAAAVVALTAGDLPLTTGPAHPGRRRGGGRVPAVSAAHARVSAVGAVTAVARGRPRRVRRPGHGRPGRRPAGWTCMRRTGSRTTRSACWARCTGTSCALLPRRARRAAGRGAAFDLASVGIDAWGVRLRPARRGRRAAGNPVHYRDAPDRGRRRAGAGPRSRPPSCTRSPASSSCRSTRSTSSPRRPGRRSWPRPRACC